MTLIVTSGQGKTTVNLDVLYLFKLQSKNMVPYRDHREKDRQVINKKVKEKG